MRLGAYEFLLNKDVNFIREAYPSPTDLGTPAYYALFDENTFILGPTPNATYTTWSCITTITQSPL
jgi:hypothetical protein